MEPQEDEQSAAGTVPGNAQDNSTQNVPQKPVEAAEPKIVELRKRILDGTYKVDANDLSAKIVDEHLRK